MDWKSKFKKLRPEDRQRLEQKHKQLTFDISQGSEDRDIITMPHIIGDTGTVKSEINRLARLIDIDMSLEAKGNTRQMLYRRMKQIEDEILKVIPSVTEANLSVRVNGSAEFERAVKKQMVFMKDYIKLCEEWKQIKNRLEPEDPIADDLSTITPKGGGYREAFVSA